MSIVNIGQQGLGQGLGGMITGYQENVSTHYSSALSQMLKNMSIDDLVKESKRNPFLVEIERRQEEARKAVESAQHTERWIEQQVTEARERFKHL